MDEPGTIADRTSNWGRWGDADQRGALNLLSEERVARALAQPRRGRVYMLGTEVGKHGPLSGGRNATWHVTTQVFNPNDQGRGRAEDMLVMHSHAHTHIDALAHVWVDGKLYNGVSSNAVSRGGTKHASIEHHGLIIGSAVILDVSNVRPLIEGDLITAGDLEAAQEEAGVDAAAADILLVRTGWIEMHAKDPDRFVEGEPGLTPEAATWIAGRDPAVVGIDNFGLEPIPAPKGINPLHCHEFFLRDLGVPLIENLDLTEPAADGVAEGLFLAAPLRIDRGLGSPLNPALVV